MQQPSPVALTSVRKTTNQTGGKRSLMSPQYGVRRSMDAVSTATHLEQRHAVTKLPAKASCDSGPVKRCQPPKTGKPSSPSRGSIKERVERRPEASPPGEASGVDSYSEGTGNPDWLQGTCPSLASKRSMRCITTEAEQALTDQIWHPRVGLRRQHYTTPTLEALRVAARHFLDFPSVLNHASATISSAGSQRALAARFSRNVHSR